MKCSGKILALILCLTLTAGTVLTASAAGMPDAGEVRCYTVPLISNETEEDHVSIYGYNGKYYFDLQDIGKMTRCTLTEDDEAVTLCHELREIRIEKNTGNMTEVSIREQGSIPLLEYDGKYLCEGIPMLTYLGAECSVGEGPALEVLMPQYTIWEALMSDFLDYYFDLSAFEGNRETALMCDVLSSLLGDMAGCGTFVDAQLETALYEIVNVDLLKGDSDTRNILGRTICEDVFEAVGYQEIAWSGISSRISERMEGNDSDVSDVAVQQNTASVNVLWLSLIQYDVAQLAAHAFVKAGNEEHFSDEKTMETMKDLFALYYCTTIALSENLARAAGECGAENKEAWRTHYGSGAGDSAADYAAEYLYRITNCTNVPIVDYSGLKDEVLTEGWLNSF